MLVIPASLTKETITAKAELKGRFVRQSGGKVNTAIAGLKLSLLPPVQV